MIAIQENFPRFTPEEYFEWEEQQNCRHEYLNGEVYAMTGGSLNHSEIALNFGSLLKNHMRGSDCQVRNSDARVNIANSTDYTYPDLSVTCDERDSHSETLCERSNTQYITYPCLIVEVLSPGTEAYDRGNKFRVYRQNSSLQEYVLVDANSMEIEMFRRNNGNNWQIIDYKAGDTVELTSVNLTFAFAKRCLWQIEQVYEEIIFTENIITK
jgi:Uma2 family endonuclease